MKNGDILISGASVAGPALAYWLCRRGFRPIVVERAPAPRVGGQAVDLRGSAREVIERMGLMEQVRRAHTGVRGMSYVNADGRHTARMAADAFGDSGGMIAEIEILRSDLVSVLYEATRHDVEYVFADSITELVQDEDGVRASFENSAPRRFDLVVGADGLRSNVRALTFGPDSRFVTDLGYHLAIFGTRTDVEMNGWQLMHSAPPSRLASLYPVRDKGEARGMFFFAGPQLDYDRRDIARQKEIVARCFAGVGWQVPAMLDSLHGADDFYLDRANLVKVAEWSRGRSVLLGDSVFGGSVGMGTSMAVVGAYVLAGELAATRDHRAALRSYQDTMSEYVRRCQQPMPGGLRGFLPRTARGVWLRDQSIRMMMRLPGKGMITNGLQKTANAVRLADYPDHTDYAGYPG